MANLAPNGLEAQAQNGKDNSNLKPQNSKPGMQSNPAEWEPKILAFCCNWCTYTGADLAGLNRMKYPDNIRVIRVPCSGRVNPQFIFRAFQKGYDGVLVCGCHPGDCHYTAGNYYTRRRFLLMKRLLEYAGIDPGRFQARWISGSEAAKFRDTISKVTEEIKALGPNYKLKEE